MNKRNVDGFDLTFSSDWTKKIESREHWGYYWRQASLVEDHVSRDDRILEIGVGSGFLQNYLKSRGWDSFSVDIDENKAPDFVSDASTFNFNHVSPDCFLAFEIFEHIPFPLFSRTIKNIASSNPKNIIFSLPISLYFVFELKFKLPKLGFFEINIPMPKFKIKTENHFWELGMFGYSDSGALDGSRKGVVGIKDINNIFNQYAYSVTEVSREGRIVFFLAQPFSKDKNG